MPVFYMVKLLICSIYLPDWVPFWGGDRFQFFKPVFNVADSSISIGIISLLIFQRQFFKTQTTSQTEEQQPQGAAVNVSVEKE